MSSQNWSKREGNFYIFFYSEENDLIQSRFASSKLAFSFLIESIWGSQWDAGCWDSRQEVDAVRFVISQDVLDGGGCMNNDSRSLDQNEKGKKIVYPSGTPDRCWLLLVVRPIRPRRFVGKRKDFQPLNRSVSSVQPSKANSIRVD